MNLALRLAQRARGRTSPNPAVGAVIVKNNRIVGRGYHRRAGLPHAEVEALRRAGWRARGSTLYVTLEPCNHTGRTPPCCDAILASGVARVVAATRDPNPLTDGRGLARLRRAGLQVRTGVLARAAQQINEPFFTSMRTRMPLVIAKAGQSLDGKIATSRGASRWITSAASRRQSHRLRAQVDAVLVGITTVLRDDPLLTARPPRSSSGSGRGGTAPRRDRPVKVIVDSRLRLLPTARCLSSRSPAPTLIATTVRTSPRVAPLERRGAELLRFRPEQGRVPLRRLCQELARRGMHSVLIEGGGEVLASAFAERIVDRIAWFVAPMLIGGRHAPGALGGQGIARLADAVRLRAMRVRRLGPDVWIEARVAYPGR